MKEYLLDAPLTKEFFAYLGNFGQVESLPAVGEGFYKLEKQDWFSIKGFVGDTTVEVRFKKEVMDLTTDFVYFLFTSFREGPVDLSALKRREQSIGERVQKRLYGK
ncbi:MAG: hypothetical protein QCH35_04855 [Methanomicrobiaceae archaeon]|nr:hypothetical protein [Methanomicrobiaceae archaeon]